MRDYFDTAAEDRAAAISRYIDTVIEARRRRASWLRRFWNWLVAPLT